MDGQEEGGNGWRLESSARHCHGDPIFFSSKQPWKKKVCCARKHRRTPTVRDGSPTVAAGHTSGGTVGQRTRVGEGKMNQVAQHRLMISEGIGWEAAKIFYVRVINPGTEWVCVCESICRMGLLQLIIRLRCDTPLPHLSRKHTRTHKRNHGIFLPAAR